MDAFVIGLCKVLVSLALVCMALVVIIGYCMLIGAAYQCFKDAVYHARMNWWSEVLADLGGGLLFTGVTLAVPFAIVALELLR